MTALPTLADLRRIALPAHLLGHSLAGLSPAPKPAAPAPRSARPHLIATWHADPSGRLVCRWAIRVPTG